MQHAHLRFGLGFRVVLGDGHSQAARMTLAPGESEGGPGNRHRGADPWLYVVSGTGEAVVNGERRELRAGMLLLIQRGDKHEVRNPGREPARNRAARPWTSGADSCAARSPRPCPRDPPHARPRAQGAGSVNSPLIKWLIVSDAPCGRE
jgi:hypothetical protein